MQEMKKSKDLLKSLTKIEPFQGSATVSNLIKPTDLCLLIRLILYFP